MRTFLVNTNLGFGIISLLEGLEVVKWDLDGAVVDFAEAIHMLLFFTAEVACIRGWFKGEG